MQSNEKSNHKAYSLTALTALLALAGTFGCSAADGADAQGADVEQISDVGEAVTGGTALTNPDPVFSPIVKITLPNGVFCTGYKVAPTLYVTGTGCGFQSSIGQVVTVTNARNGTGGMQHSITQVFLHPTQLGNANGIAYDTAIVKLGSRNPSIPALDPSYATQASGQSGIMTGFGCDALNPSRSGTLQFGTASASTTGHPSGPAFDPLYFFTPGSNPQLCGQDGGGPFFTVVNGAWKLSGFASGTPGGGSSFSRAYNVQDWILAVSNGLLGHNDFGVGKVGTFINRASNLCLLAAGANGGPAMQTSCTMSGAVLERFSVADPLTGSLWFKNPATQRCLVPSLDGLSVVSGTCDGPSTQWNVTGSGNFRPIVNAASGKCMAAHSTINGSLFDLAACDSSNNAQKWLFSK
jgi:hypothetical protein